MCFVQLWPNANVEYVILIIVLYLVKGVQMKTDLASDAVVHDLKGQCP